MIFSLGNVVATPGAMELFAGEVWKIELFLIRHSSGDWGDVDKEDVAENDLSVKKGFRVLSSYEYRGVTFWIITEADRSVTTILLPDEY